MLSHHHQAKQSRRARRYHEAANKEPIPSTGAENISTTKNSTSKYQSQYAIDYILTFSRPLTRPQIFPRSLLRAATVGFKKPFSSSRCLSVWFRSEQADFATLLFLVRPNSGAIRSNTESATSLTSFFSNFGVMIACPVESGLVDNVSVVAILYLLFRTGPFWIS